jgi:hypothetical protein
MLNETHILATSEDRAEEMAMNVRLLGGNVRRTTIWKGVVPPNSFHHIGFNVRMSAPEFFLFRKMAQNSDVDARTYACEMLGTVATSLTMSDLDEGEYAVLEEPRLTVPEMLDYLSPVHYDNDVKRVESLILGICGTSLIDDYGRFVKGCYTLAE